MHRHTSACGVSPDGERGHKKSKGQNSANDSPKHEFPPVDLSKFSLDDGPRNRLKSGQHCKSDEEIEHFELGLFALF
jgi:hypothetical protein